MRRALILAAGLALAGCSAPSEQPTVFAAASLHEVLPQIAPEVNYSFDGSSGLVDQIAGGAPADVLASADEATMSRAAEQGLIAGEPLMFATNHLVLAVPSGNPAGITGLDISLDGAKLVVCAPEVPCGAATTKLAEANGITLTPVSEESNVTDVLGKVASGEADAGLVYATEAASSAVETIEVPGAVDHPNTYWVAVVKDGPNPEAARTFVASLAGEWGTQLQQFGFGLPA